MSDKAPAEPRLWAAVPQDGVGAAIIFDEWARSDSLPFLRPRAAFDDDAIALLEGTRLYMHKNFPEAVSDVEWRLPTSLYGVIRTCFPTSVLLKVAEGTTQRLKQAVANGKLPQSTNVHVTVAEVLALFAWSLSGQAPRNMVSVDPPAHQSVSAFPPFPVDYIRRIVDHKRLKILFRYCRGWQSPPAASSSYAVRNDGDAALPFWNEINNVLLGFFCRESMVLALDDDLQRSNSTNHDDSWLPLHYLEGKGRGVFTDMLVGTISGMPVHAMLRRRGHTPDGQVVRAIMALNSTGGVYRESQGVLRLRFDRDYCRVSSVATLPPFNVEPLCTLRRQHPNSVPQLPFRRLKEQGGRTVLRSSKRKAPPTAAATEPEKTTKKKRTMKKATRKTARKTATKKKKTKEKKKKKHRKCEVSEDDNSELESGEEYDSGEYGEYDESDEDSSSYDSPAATAAVSAASMDGGYAAVQMLTDSDDEDCDVSADGKLVVPALKQIQRELATLNKLCGMDKEVATRTVVKPKAGQLKPDTIVLAPWPEGGGFGLFVAVVKQRPSKGMVLVRFYDNVTDEVATSTVLLLDTGPSWSEKYAYPPTRWTPHQQIQVPDKLPDAVFVAKATKWTIKTCANNEIERGNGVLSDQSKRNINENVKRFRWVLARHNKRAVQIITGADDPDSVSDMVFTPRPASSRRANVPYASADDARSVIEQVKPEFFQSTVFVTNGQRDRAWFAARVAVITSTSAARLCRLLNHLDFGTNAAPQAHPLMLSRELEVQVVQAVLDASNLKGAGKGSGLAETFRRGREGEELAKLELASFLERVSPYKVVHMYEIGLAVDATAPWVGTSVDGLLVLSDMRAADDAITMLVPLEVKTSTNMASVARAQSTSPTKKFQRVAFSSALVEQHLPAEHRVQILHHAAVMHLDQVLYVKRGDTGILWCMLVHFNEPLPIDIHAMDDDDVVMLDASGSSASGSSGSCASGSSASGSAPWPCTPIEHRRRLVAATERLLGWTNYRRSQEQIERLDRKPPKCSKEFLRAVEKCNLDAWGDMGTVRWRFSLSIALREYAFTTGAVPVVESLLSVAQYRWNVEHGGVDVTSRHVRNIEHVEQADTSTKITLRMLRVLLVAAYKLCGLTRIHEPLTTQRLKSARAQVHAAAYGNFPTFVMYAINAMVCMAADGEYRFPNPAAAAAAAAAAAGPQRSVAQIAAEAVAAAMVVPDIAPPGGW